MIEASSKEARNEIDKNLGPWIDKFVESCRFQRLADSHRNETRGLIGLSEPQRQLCLRQWSEIYDRRTEAH